MRKNRKSCSGFWKTGNGRELWQNVFLKNRICTFPSMRHRTDMVWSAFSSDKSHWMRLRTVSCFLFWESAPWHWIGNKVREKKKRRQSWRKMSSFGWICCGRFPMICAHHWHQFSAMQTLWSVTLTHWTKGCGNRFFRIFMRMPDGWLNWWKICLRLRK